MFIDDVHICLYHWYIPICIVLTNPIVIEKPLGMIRPYCSWETLLLSINQWVLSSTLLLSIYDWDQLLLQDGAQVR